MTQIQSVHILCADLKLNLKKKVNFTEIVEVKIILIYMYIVSSIRQNDKKISIKPVFVKKSVNSLCALMHLSSLNVFKISQKDQLWHFYPLPTILKIHQSIMDYIYRMNTYKEKNDTENIKNLSEGASLTIEYAPDVLQSLSSR